MQLTWKVRLRGKFSPGSWVIEPNQPAEHNAETNSIYWDIGTIPNLLGDHQPLARLTFKVKVTTNCFYLTVDECSSSVDIVEHPRVKGHFRHGVYISHIYNRLSRGRVC